MKYIIGKNIKSFNSINDYHGLGKEVAKALAEGKEVDIKNGAAGFTGNLVDAPSDHYGVWGYDYQILRVIR